jgi:hypothetical protein
MLFEALDGVYRATATGRPMALRCVIGRSCYFPPTYFTTRLFFTDVTPLTLLVISTALLTAFWELTKPLSWTSPLKDSTPI